MHCLFLLSPNQAVVFFCLSLSIYHPHTPTHTHTLVEGRTLTTHWGPICLLQQQQILRAWSHLWRTEWKKEKEHCECTLMSDNGEAGIGLGTASPKSHIANNASWSFLCFEFQHNALDVQWIECFVPSMFACLYFHGNLFRKRESGFRQIHLLTSTHFIQIRQSALCLAFNFQAYMCMHTYTHSVLTQSDRLTSCPKAFWLVKRDRELYCFLCDSVITQRLTQWNSSVTPKGFGPRESGQWKPLSFLLSHSFSLSFTLSPSISLSDRHTHTLAHDVAHLFRHCQTNSRNYG